MTGGQLIVVNDDTRVGDDGAGEMSVSNAIATLNNLVAPAWCHQAM
jgi:hypothetical protein